MSHLSNLFGTPDEPDHIRTGSWTLCAGCSKGRHLDHGGRCDCDLCADEGVAA